MDSLIMTIKCLQETILSQAITIRDLESQLSEMSKVTPTELLTNINGGGG